MGRRGADRYLWGGHQARRGARVGHTQSAFEIVKVGIEQFIASTANQHGLAYALATADDQLDGIDHLPKGLRFTSGGHRRRQYAGEAILQVVENRGFLKDGTRGHFRLHRDFNDIRVRSFVLNGAPFSYHSE